MSVRVNQRWPDELHKAVVAAAGVRGVTRFTLDALERALEEASGRGLSTGEAAADESVPAPPRTPTSKAEMDGLRNVAESMHEAAAERIREREARPAVSGSVRPAIPKKEK